MANARRGGDWVGCRSRRAPERKSFPRVAVRLWRQTLLREISPRRNPSSTRPSPFGRIVDETLRSASDIFSGDTALSTKTMVHTSTVPRDVVKSGSRVMSHTKGCTRAAWSGGSASQRLRTSSTARGRSRSSTRWRGDRPRGAGTRCCRRPHPPRGRREVGWGRGAGGRISARGQPRGKIRRKFA